MAKNLFWYYIIKIGNDIDTIEINAELSKGILLLLSLIRHI
jgi:hypothetical protein